MAPDQGRVRGRQFLGAAQAQLRHAPQHPLLAGQQSRVVATVRVEGPRGLGQGGQQARGLADGQLRRGLAEVGRATVSTPIRLLPRGTRSR